MEDAEGDSGKAPAVRYPITSVDNALRLLLLFRDEPFLRVAGAAEHLGVARSTAHRLIRMLALHGFIRQEPESRAYVPGSALLDVGLSVIGRLDLRRAARPRMEALAAETGETVHLARLELPNVVFVDCVESDKAIRVSSRVGQLMPAHWTSVGKAMLAVDGRGLEQYSHADRLPVLTSKSIPTRARLDDELVRVRDQGYATSVEESEEGVGSVGVAVVDRSGRVLGGLSVAAPLFRLDDSHLPRFVAAVTRAAADVGSCVG
jgi:DNA-binding IclR family transcriptional regulator